MPWHPLGHLPWRAIAYICRMLTQARFGYTAEEITQLMGEGDTNHDGVIDYDEFVVLMRGIQLTPVRRPLPPPPPPNSFTPNSPRFILVRPSHTGDTQQLRADSCTGG